MWRWPISSMWMHKLAIATCPERFSCANRLLEAMDGKPERKGRSALLGPGKDRPDDKWWFDMEYVDDVIKSWG